jgi:hypothetical protein
MRVAALFPLLIASCVSAPPLEAPNPHALLFSPQRFFVGRTEGTGLLRTIFSSPRSVRVHGSGRMDGDAVLVLDQRVEEQGKPVLRREWRMREAEPGHMIGTLTGATGAIQGFVSGNRLRLRFRMKGGLDAEQSIYLKPGGTSAHNLMIVRKFGIVVATLDETIDRVE